MRLNPENSVIIFGDCQENVLDLPLTVSAEKIRLAVCGLARIAEIFDIPTFAMSIPKRDGDRPVILREIDHFRKSYRTFMRATPDSFEHEEFRSAVAETGRKTLVVCGIATEICLQWLALSGLDAGYEVHVVVDACAGIGARSETAAFQRLVQAGVKMTSVVSLAGEFVGELAEPRGVAALEVIYDMVGADLPPR